MIQKLLIILNNYMYKVIMQWGVQLGITSTCFAKLQLYWSRCHSGYCPPKMWIVSPRTVSASGLCPPGHYPHH